MNQARIKSLLIIILVLGSVSCSVVPTFGLSREEQDELIRLEEKIELASVTNKERDGGAPSGDQVKGSALSADEQKEYSRLFTKLIDAAEKGDSDSQGVIGYSLKFGDLGLAKDYEKAATWMLKSAEQGNAAAQNIVGDMYYQGKGFLLNARRAFQWYEKSAAQGYAEAYCNLGDLYYRGYGTKKDYVKAKENFEKGSEEEEITCIFFLARMHSNGDGIPVNKAKAIELWEKATLKGSVWAPYEIFKVYRDDGIKKDSQVMALKWIYVSLLRGITPENNEAREELITKLTPDQVNQARLLQEEWIKKTNYRWGNK